MAKKIRENLYCVQMYLTGEEHERFQSEQSGTDLSESAFCRRKIFDLMPLKRGAKAGNKNASKNKEKRTAVPEAELIGDALQPKRRRRCKTGDKNRLPGGKVSLSTGLLDPVDLNSGVEVQPLSEKINEEKGAEVSKGSAKLSGNLRIRSETPKGEDDAIQGLLF